MAIARAVHFGARLLILDEPTSALGVKQSGVVLKYILQGGPLVGPATLLRFFMAHVFLLPGVMSLLLFVHFRLARRQGPAEPA